MEEGMRKTILTILFVLVWAISFASAAPLKVGAKAPDFKLKDTTDKEFSLNAPEWKGKGLLFIAMTIEESKTNAAVSKEIAKADIVKGNKFAGAAIFFAPSAAASAALRDRQKTTGKIFLIDGNDIMAGLWGLQRNASNVVFLDKGRICRYLYKGKLSEAEFAKLIWTIKTYQAK
jgi:predicted transcriptional regulator